jgi:hypothetical protein
VKWKRIEKFIVKVPFPHSSGGTWKNNRTAAGPTKFRTGDNCFVNTLTPELNPSAQRCLTRFLLGILLLEPCISLIYA